MRHLVILIVRHNGFASRSPWRCAGRLRRICSCQTSVIDPQPSRRRAPNLRVLDRLIAGFCSLWITPNRLRRVAIAFKPSTLLKFHRGLVQRKYRLRFSPKQRTKTGGAKGPDGNLIHAVVEMKLIRMWPVGFRLSIANRFFTNSCSTPRLLFESGAGRQAVVTAKLPH